MDLLHFLASGICAQRPEHTVAIAGRFLPLEARMGGLFTGFLLGVLLLIVLERGSAGLLPRGGTAALLVAGVAATGLDGLNASLFDYGLPHLYSPTLTLRLATGLTAGFGVAAFTLPVVAATLLKEADFIPSLDGYSEVIVGYALLAGIQLATQLDVAALYWPLAGLQVVGVLASAVIADLYLLALLLRRVRAAASWSTLAPLGAVAVVVALLKLSALAELRMYAEAALGVHWIA